MKKLFLFGASGFIGKNFQSNLKGEIFKISIREQNWDSNILPDSFAFINLVGKAHDHNKTATEQDFFYANVDLVKDIFNKFIKSDAKLLIHISSLAALEEVKSSKPLTEVDICNPISLYGKSKRAAEIWLMEQNIPDGKKIIILRPPMVHGSGDKGNLGLLYKFISKGIPYPLASFKNRRSFISIDNLCFFVNQIIEKEEKLGSGVYHVSDDEAISTNQIINIIRNIENKKMPNLSIPKFFINCIAKIGDIIPIPLNTLRLKKMTSDLILSNQKIKSALGIEKLPLSAEEGLIKTIKSFKETK